MQDTSPILQKETTLMTTELETFVRDIANTIRTNLENQDIPSSVNVHVMMNTRTHGDRGTFTVTIDDGGYSAECKAASHDPDAATEEFLRRKGWQQTQRLQLTQAAAE